MSPPAPELTITFDKFYAPAFKGYILNNRTKPEDYAQLKTFFQALLSNNYPAFPNAGSLLC